MPEERLPYQRDFEAASGHRLTGDSDAALLRVLLADDDKADRIFVRRALQRSGLPVEIAEAQNVEEAMLSCEECIPDCVLMDYCLPGENGLIGLTLIRERWPEVATVMLTGSGDELVASEAIKRGACDYLSKDSMTPSAIARSVERAVETAKLQYQLALQREELAQFNSKVVHDLRQPLRTVALTAEMIKRSLESAEALDRTKQLCENIVGSAKSAFDLLKTLQQYTQVNADVPFGPVDLNLVLKAVLRDLAAVIEECRAHITVGDLPVVKGNTALLAQLFQNLISNSIKFCRDKLPVISIACAEHSSGTAVCSLTDNGIGIPEKSYKEIFKPFKRLHLGDEFEGSGLGLATCRKIVERHGGTLWCHSQVGSGTTFYLTLTMAEMVQASEAGSY